MSSDPRCFSPPERFSNLNVLVSGSPLGALASTLALKCAGHWSNFDVWVAAPFSALGAPAWFTAGGGVTVRVFGRQDNARVLLVSTNLEVTNPMNNNGVGSVLAAQVRGKPCDSIEVELVGSAGAVGNFGGAGSVWLDCWGDESTPIALGEPLTDAIANPLTPSFGSHLLAWNPTLATWQRVKVDAAGGIVVSVDGGAQTAVRTSVTGVSSLIVLGNSGTLRSLAGSVDPSAPSALYYLQVYNLTAVPADGDRHTSFLLDSTPVNHTNGVPDVFTFAGSIPPGGLICSVGCVLTLSTTQFTKTASAFLNANGSGA